MQAEELSNISLGQPYNSEGREFPEISTLVQGPSTFLWWRRAITILIFLPCLN